MAAKIEKREVIQKLIDGLRLDVGLERIPMVVMDRVVPTFDIGEDKDINIVSSGSSASTGTVTVFTTPTDQDFYLFGASLSYDKDATADNTIIQMIATPRGKAAANIMNVLNITTTARQDSLVVAFERGILLDRNSTITLTGAFTVGALTRAANIWGYQRDGAS